MTARRDRRRTGTPAWVRLGELLAGRREELDPAYYNRNVFAAGRGVNLKMSEDIENNARENFTPVTLRDKIAPAYGVTYESVQDVLDGRPGSDLEPAPATPPRRRREQPPAGPAPRPAPPPPGHTATAIPRSPDDTVQQMIRDVPGEWEKVEPLYAQVVERAALVIASLGGAVPPGGLIFNEPGEEWLRSEWDHLAGTRKKDTEDGPGKLWTADDVVTGIAVRLYQAGYGRQRDPGTASAGLTRQSASAQLKRSPGARVRQDATRR